MTDKQTGAPGYLLRNMVLFGRVLRRLGIDVTPTNLIDLVEAVSHLGIRRRQDFKNAARTILINRHEHLSLFDHVFELFWTTDRSEATPIDLGVLLKKSLESQQETGLPELPEEEGSWVEKNAQVEDLEPGTIRTYSAQEALHQKDFAELTTDELTQVKQLMRRMTWELAKRRTRRKIAGSTKTYLDLRRTLRDNLRHGGEPLLLKWRQPKQKRRPLVVLCDISGSMEPYSRLLLRFIYIISNGLEKVEAFTFGTRLTRITHHLADHEIDRALTEATQVIEDWAGGTRMGETLKTFNYEWARRVLGQGAIVLIISDGWDCGNIRLLEKEVARLQRSCQRLIWLNPLLGSPRYEPLTRGIQAALPYIDDFLPVHNLVSLEQLGSLLENLNDHRPLRRQGGLIRRQPASQAYQ